MAVRPRRPTTRLADRIDCERPAGLTAPVSAVSAEPLPPRTLKTARTVRFTFDVARDQLRFIKHYVLDADTTDSAATRALWQLVAEDNGLAQCLHSRLVAQRTLQP